MKLNTYHTHKYLLKIFLVFILGISLNINAQEVPVVSGIVTDAASRQPVAGASIKVENYSSAITDDQGKFSIKVPNNKVTLKVTSAGYQQKEVALKGRNEISVALFEAGFSSMYEQAVMPMETKSRSSVTNSVVSLGSEGYFTGESVDQMMQGKIAGMRVLMQSGVPGIGANMFIRGFSSLNSSNQPLIVVDGMIYEKETFSNSAINGFRFNPLSDIDVKDIANITVIKDASSIYGSKAANGVILIETTRTKDVATKIDFYAQGGMNYSPAQLPLMNASQYRVYSMGQLRSAGYTDDQIAAQPYLNDNPSYENYAMYHNNTNWQNLVFNNSYSSDYYLKVTGGDEVAKYGLSIGYMGHGGVVKNTDFSRLTARFNADSYISQKLLFNASVNFSYQSNSLKDDGMVYRSSPIFAALKKAPVLGPYNYDQFGQATNAIAGIDSIGFPNAYDTHSNPLALIDNVKADNNNYKLFGNARFSYLLSKTMTISSLIGVNWDKNRDIFFLPQNGVEPSRPDLYTEYFRTSGNRLERLFSVFNDTRFSYNNTFNGIHSLMFNLGFRYDLNNYENDLATSQNAGDDQFTGLQSGDRKTYANAGNIGNWKWVSYYSNLDYGLYNKYFLSLNLSVDGSSRFGSKTREGFQMGNHSYGVFPSAGAAWLISSENFMANNRLIDLLKLRATYGITGNDGIGNYTAQSYFISKRLLEGTGIISGNLGNPELQWEKTTKTNIGLDLGLFNERLFLTADYFNNVTDNMLNIKQVDPFFGYGYYLNNDGKLENKGFEFGMNSRIVNKSSFKWDFGFNVSHYKNKLLALPGGTMETDIPGTGATILNKEGNSAGLFYGYKTDGIFKNEAEASAAGLNWRDYKGELQAFRAGDVHFVNQNSDNVIDENDRVVIGDPNPDFAGFVYNTFTYRNLSLNVTFTFSQGNDVYNALRANLESMNGFGNQSQAVANRWMVENQETDMPRAVYGDPMGNGRFSDRWIEDGSFVRLKNVTLSYSPKLTRFVKSSTFFISANNLFTFSKYLGFDPEFSMSGSSYSQGIDAGFTPQFKSVFVGIRIGL